MNIETIKQLANGTWVVVLENGRVFSGIDKQDVIDFANEWMERNSNMALHHNIKKTLLHTFYYANNKITCIRCNISGKFVSIKKYLAKQKANVIVSSAKASNVKANKHSSFMSLFIMLVFAAVAYVLCFNTIVERQQHYDSVNSVELLENYYTECSTDLECEELESKLNFDFKKGVN